MANAQTKDGVATNSDEQKPPRVAHWAVGWGVGVLAFGLGSLKSDAIKQAFPFCCVAGRDDYPIDPRSWTWSQSALAFWIFAFVWAILYGSRLRAESKQAALLRKQAGKLATTVAAIEGGTTALQEATKAVLGTVAETAKTAKDLDGSIKKTSETIEQIKEDAQTLPPENYVTALVKNTNFCHVLCGGKTPRQKPIENTKTDLEPVIRKLLGTMALLAETYDSSGWRYAANVMYFVPSTQIEFQSSYVQTYERFLPVPHPADVLKGALVLRKSLSATANADTDDEVRETSFPILKPYQDDKGKFRVLPGAPMACAESENGRQSVLFYAFLDSWTIGKQLRDGYAFDDKVISRIEHEYGKDRQGRWVRSGMMFPLFEIASVREKLIGILNVHCNRDQMLGNPKRQLLFARTTVHLVNDVAEATGLWLRA